MDRFEVKKYFLEKNIKNPGSFRQTIKKYDRKIYDFIISETKYLKKDNFSERIYHILNDLYEIPKCECGNILKYINSSLTYRKFCGVKCFFKNEEMKRKLKITLFILKTRRS